MRAHRVFVVGFVVACALFMPLSLSAAEITGLDSILQIPDGTTLNFEGVADHSNPNNVLEPYGITTDSTDVTQFVTWVTGNTDAPIGGNAVFGPNTFSTSVGWSSVGFSAVSTLAFVSQTFDITAYDQNDDAVYSDSYLFAPEDEAEYNADAFFFGVSSTTPIWSISISSSNPNYAIDSFTFISVPEPGSLVLLTMAAPMILRRRR
jgi:hypothetical protein